MFLKKDLGLNGIQYYKVWLETLLLLVLPFVLLILPSDYFDKGKSICISKLLLNIECYACGMTRACMHLIHFEFEEAYHFNPLVFAVIPLLCYLFLSRIKRNTGILLKNG